MARFQGMLSAALHAGTMQAGLLCQLPISGRGCGCPLTFFLAILLVRMGLEKQISIYFVASVRTEHK